MGDFFVKNAGSRAGAKLKGGRDQADLSYSNNGKPKTFYFAGARICVDRLHFVRLHVIIALRSRKVFVKGQYLFLLYFMHLKNGFIDYLLSTVARAFTTYSYYITSSAVKFIR